MEIAINKITPHLLNTYRIRAHQRYIARGVII